MYSTLSMLETEAYSPHAPLFGSLQSAPRSTHRSTSYVTARLAPALAAGSSQVSTTTRRWVPGGTVMSPNCQFVALTVPQNQRVVQPGALNCAQCSRYPETRPIPKVLLFPVTSSWAMADDIMCARSSAGLLRNSG